MKMRPRARHIENNRTLAPPFISLVLLDMTQDACVNRGLKNWTGAWVILASVLFFSYSGQAQFYNGSQLTFGKSRVQYNDFLWLYFRFEKFDTYYYLNGRELALYASEYADKHIKEIEISLQSNLEEKIQFIIFNKLSDLKQSNIGLFGDWDYYNTGCSCFSMGTMKILISKSGPGSPR
jgi:hypothetical protein